MFTLIGWHENVDSAGVYDPISALADPHVFVTGDIVRVPSALTMLVAAAGMIESATATRCRLVSPSIRRKNNFHIVPLNQVAAAGVEPGSPQAVVDLRDNPFKLIGGENFTAEIFSDPVAVQRQTVLAWLADGPIQRAKGEMFTIRATNTTTLTAGAWTNGALTLEQDLPRGRYSVVGMRALSTGLVAARLVPVGHLWRPGCLGTDDAGDIAHPMFRYGELGEWAQFEDTDPPTVDFLSISADSSQVVFLDLIEVRLGPA